MSLFLKEVTSDRPCSSLDLLKNTSSLFCTLGTSLLCASSLLVACMGPVEETHESTRTSLNSESTSSLGTVSGALTIPDESECHTFIARDLETQEPVFSLDVEMARVRNNHYSFLQYLPIGEYALEGVLLCEGEEGEEEILSLPDRFEVLEDVVAEAEFKFFVDTSEELGEVDLLFCADLLLQRLQPAGVACTGEEVNAEYKVEWYREECGALQLAVKINENEGTSDPFAFPQDRVETKLRAPDEPGISDLTFALKSEEGDYLELSSEPFEIINCDDPEIEVP